jgi:copper transport protein
MTMRQSICSGSTMVALVAMLFWLALAGIAGAHSSLISSVPEDGAVLSAAPSSYSLTFNEPVSPISLKLLKPEGTALALDRFALKDHTLEIAAPAALARGTYALSWRVISEDGHPVGGSVVFSIGERSAAPMDLGNDVDWTVRAGLWIGTVALYAGLFAGAGGAFAIAWLMRTKRHGRAVVLVALAIGLAGALLSAGFQGLDTLGVDAGRLTDPLVWQSAVETSFGGTLSVAIVALAAAGGSLFIRGDKSLLCALAGMLAAGTALTLSGHAAAAEPQWLMRPAVFLHGLTIAWWTGALIPLGLALKCGAPEAAAALRRFSATIPWVVGVLIVAGLALAIVQVEGPQALLDTGYGLLLLAKLALVALLLALAAYNRWKLTKPTISGDAPAATRLARVIAAEAAVALLILAVVACWRFTPPPRAVALAAAEPAQTHIHAARAMADLTVAPGSAGPVDVSIFVMTGDFDPLAAKEITLVLTNPAAGIEPIRRPARKADDGTWRVEGLTLPAGGTWKVRLDVLISDFDMVQLEGKIRIRP